MKRELKLNFGELRLVQKRVTEFQDALSDIDEAAAYFDEVLGKQESEAAEVLVERHREMEEEIRYFQDILSRLETLLGNYISDMENYIMPKDENRMMLVDRNDIWWNMKQIGGNLSSAKNVASGMELSYYSGIDTTPSPPHIYEGMSPGAQSAAWERYRRQLLESRNRKANYSKLQSFCSGTAGSAKSSLEEFYDSLEEIYKKHVIEFENTDDDYKRKAAQVYDACTSAGERFWDIGTKLGKLVNDINDGIDAAVFGFVSEILGLAFTLAKIDVALRVAVVTAPFGITPQWVKDMGKEAVEGLEGIAAILRNPGRALASLGQQVTDTVEEKGIAYALSYVTADIVIGILVDKGIGKIRGMNKADDLAKLSTKVDDVVNVADDLGDAAKVVDKIDDVADMADDVAVFGDIEGNTYLGDLMSSEEAARYSEYWRKCGIGSDNTWKVFKDVNPNGTIDDYFEIVQKQSPWPLGETGTPTTLKAGDRFFMAVENNAPENVIGGFGVKERIESTDFVRNNLSVKYDWKTSCNVIREFEVNSGIELNVNAGPVGPQIDLGADLYLPGDTTITQYDLFSNLGSGIKREDYVHIVDEYWVD